MNYYIQDFCCVCLSISNEKCSNKSSTYVDNLTPLEKITTVFSELSSVMESDDRICTKCSDTVGFIYEFHKTCLKNINTFSSYKRILKENQPKKQCGLLVDLNESKKFNDNTLISKEIKIEPPESPLNNDYILFDANFVSESHLSGATDLNYETDHGESEKSRLDSENNIDYEQTNLKKESMNEISDFESPKSDSKDFDNISVQSTEELVIGKEENQELIEDPLRGVAEEKSDEGQGHLESFRQNHSESFEEKSIHVEQKIDLDNLPIHSERKKPFECDICGKLFEQVHYLNTHKLIHTGEKPYKCDICGKLFRQIGHLKTHQLIHTGEKPHECDICRKSFTRKDDLKKHHLIHIGERSHKCDICGKSFNQSSTLIVHKLVHTGEKPYKCDICGHLFRQKGNLKKHRLTHTGEKPHKCDICGQSFIESSSLFTHKLIHTGEKPYKCDICEKLFRYKCSLRKHKLIHIGEKPHKCDICGKLFEQMCYLNTHILIHTGEKPYKCDICGKLFRQIGHLKTHQLLHTGEKPHKCDICSKSFTTKGHLKIHFLIHTGEKPHKCDICGKSFYQLSTLNTHKLIHLNESKQVKGYSLSSAEIKIESPELPSNNEDIFLNADLDSESHLSGAADVKEEIDINYETWDGESETSRLDSEFKIENEPIDLKKELMNETDEPLDVESLKSNTEDFENISVQSTDEIVIGKEENQELIEDPLRGVAEEKSDEGQGHSESFRQNHFESLEEKSIHVEQKIDSDSHMLRKKPFECDICGKLFDQMCYLNTHKLIHTGEKPYKCDICGKLFRQIGHLKTHQLIHTGEKPHECDICKKSFTRKDDLKKHNLIHTGERPHKCDICGQSFQHKSGLITHKLLHTDEKPYKCDICGHLFRQISNLKKHRLIHTGEKPHKCDICGKLFQEMSFLTRHKLTHTGEKPYKCDICGKLYRQISHLKTHQLVHTGEKPHKCDICSKSFTLNRLLKRHYLIHTDEKPYKCDICGNLFRYLSTLKKHRLTHTGEQVNESKQVTGKTLSSAEIKIESPELPSNNEDIFLNADLDSESHLSGAADVKEEIDINYETWDGESETTRLDSAFKIENDQIYMKKELMNEMDEPLDVESLKSNTEDFGNISVQSTDEIVIGKEENQELIEDPLRGVTEENLDEGQGYSESIRHNQFESFEEKPSVEQKLDSDSHMLMKKPFECGICGKLFEQVYLLNRHKRVHTGEKPYKCDICGKLFTLKGNLIKHKLIHTGEKPFKCDICGQLFTQMHSLRRHKLTKHTDAKP